jgi:hypothetical protein
VEEPSEQEPPMSEIEAEQFTGYTDNRYQHTMHTLAWISLWLIVGIGVAFGVIGFFMGLTD